MEDIAEPELVQQIRDTIDKYEIDAVFDSGMAEHLMEKLRYDIIKTDIRVTDGKIVHFKGNDGCFFIVIMRVS